jgi:adenine-specific DNA-methyltransferase
MSTVETLINEIENAELRARLSTAIAELKSRLDWGLVFERHLPERARLLAAPIKPGTVIWERRSATPRRLRVRSVENAELVVVVEPEKTSAPADAPTERIARADVLVEHDLALPVFPVLAPIGVVANGPGQRPHHAVIEGENYDAITALLATHPQAFDLIYLDPPFNTGSKDWTYDNDYVDPADTYRSSRWLAFMERRLSLTRRLLRPDGVLVVMIDEHEVHHLGMLLQQMFAGALITMVTIVINPKGTGATNFARVEEYAFFVCPSGAEVINSVPFAFGMPMEVGARDRRVIEVEGGPGLERKLALRRDGAESSSRKDRRRQFYAIHVDPASLEVKGIGPELPLAAEFSTEPVNGLVPVYPVDSKGRQRVWRYGRATMTRLIETGQIRVTRFDPARSTYSLYHFAPVDAEQAERRRPRTVWWNSAHDAGAHGSSLVNNFLGSHAQFAFPKSLYAVADTMRLVTENRPDALILDFFGGSGTTLHATMLLNAEDGGGRRCILVTNNEVRAETAAALNKQGFFRGDPEFEAAGVFESATRPRITAAVNGVRPDGQPIPGAYLDGRTHSDGFDENVEFFRLDYLDGAEIEFGLRFRELHPLLWLRAGGIGECKDLDPRKPLGLPAQSPYAVLFSPSGMRPLLDALPSRPDITHVFIVADSGDTFAQLASQLPNELEKVRLYRDYLESVRSATR